MGWSGMSDPNGSKADMVTKLKEGNYSDKYQAIKTTLKGNNFWSLMQEKGTDNVFIRLDILRYDGEEWMTKGISELDGPSEKNCPLSFLKIGTPPSDPYSIGWRQSVIDYHKQAKVIKNMPEGQLFSFNDQLFLLNESLGRKGRNVLSLGDGINYRIPASNMKHGHPVFKGESKIADRLLDYKEQHPSVDFMLVLRGLELNLTTGEIDKFALLSDRIESSVAFNKIKDKTLAGHAAHVVDDEQEPD